jgi:hypothetical protein
MPAMKARCTITEQHRRSGQRREPEIKRPPSAALARPERAETSRIMAKRRSRAIESPTTDQVRPSRRRIEARIDMTICG